MASKFNFAKSALGKSSKLKKTAIAGGLMAAVGYGAAQGDPIQHTMNATQEAIFDTDQIDNMVLGTDLRARNFVGLPFSQGATAKGGGVAGALVGGGVGAVLGRGKVGKMIGAGIGAGVGGLIGGSAGAIGESGVQGLIQPKENVAGGPFSKRRLNTVPFSYNKVNQEQVDRINQTAAEYPFSPEGSPRGYSQNPGSSFPQRMTNRSWDSATGDIVLGSYNLRRG